jgi:hypothetical protein
MARFAIAVSVGLLAVGAYSSVWACEGRAPKARVAQDALATAPVIAVRIDTPRQHVTRFIRIRHIRQRNEHVGPAGTVVHTARVAMTLGRALVTTVEAVMGTLVHAAASVV